MVEETKASKSLWPFQGESRCADLLRVIGKPLIQPPYSGSWGMKDFEIVLMFLSKGADRTCGHVSCSTRGVYWRFIGNCLRNSRMNASSKVLRVAYSFFPNYFNPCAIANSTQPCQSPGFAYDFWEDLATSMGFRIRWIVTETFGTGAPTERGSVFEALAQERYAWNLLPNSPY